MKLTNKERAALAELRELDAQQRDKLLADIHSTALANRITGKAGRIKRVRTAEDHRVVKAFGLVPRWRPKKRP